MESSVSPFKASLKWSIYSAVGLCLYSSLAILTGWFDFEQSSENRYYTFMGIAFGVTVILLIGAMLFYRKRNEGLMTFGEGLSIGIFMGIFTAVAVGMTIFIASSMMAPDIVEATEDTLNEDPEIRVPVAIAFGVAISTFMSFIGTSFILSLILKKD